MNKQNVIITHILPTGTAFGATVGKPAESVFVPGHVASPAGVVVGQEVSAMLLPNTREPDRTPWLAVALEALTPAGQVDETSDTYDRVLETLRDGGEWTDFEMSDHLGADPSVVSAALEAIYNKDLCAKYQLWRKRSDAEPSDEWFTCFPDEVEFVTEVQ